MRRLSLTLVLGGLSVCGVLLAAPTDAPVIVTTAPGDHAEEGCHDTPDKTDAAAPVSLVPYRTEELRSAFNAATQEVRVVALLAPTCGACQHGQRVVQQVFTTFPNEPRLRGFVVWLPMLQSDSEKAASSQAGSFTDSRISQQWDGDRTSGNLLAKTLHLNRTAWDVYLVYALGVQWDGETPPEPTFWMHQLRSDSGADPESCLNPTALVAKVRELLHGPSSSTSANLTAPPKKAYMTVTRR